MLPYLAPWTPNVTVSRKSRSYYNGYFKSSILRYERPTGVLCRDLGIHDANRWLASSAAMQLYSGPSDWVIGFVARQPVLNHMLVLYEYHKLDSSWGVSNLWLCVSLGCMRSGATWRTIPSRKHSRFSSEKTFLDIVMNPPKRQLRLNCHIQERSTQDNNFYSLVGWRWESESVTS